MLEESPVPQPKQGWNWWLYSHSTLSIPLWECEWGRQRRQIRMWGIRWKGSRASWEFAVSALPAWWYVAKWMLLMPYYSSFKAFLPRKTSV